MDRLLGVVDRLYEQGVQRAGAFEGPPLGAAQLRCPLMTLFLELIDWPTTLPLVDRPDELQYPPDYLPPHRARAQPAGRGRGLEGVRLAPGRGTAASEMQEPHPDL